MSHPRRIIREAVTTMLAAAGTLADDRVWSSREPPVDVESILKDEGPVILVYARMDRTATHEGHSPMGFGWERRECELVIEITGAGAVVVDNKIDDMAEQVEELMDEFAIPGMPATEMRHRETMIESSNEFEQPVGMAAIVYEACYWRQWRCDPDADEEFFPKLVSARANASAAEVVADCDDCAECPPGGLA